ADHRRVVTALKNISEGTDLEKYLDVDNILKYMAVHAFSVNLDSLSGNMAHNYYLYEYNGMLNILPWDYNLSFGGMNQGPQSSASEVINDAVDTPFSATTFFDALLENETYLSRYHEYLRQLAQEYVLNGRFQVVYQSIRSRIDRLVQTDPTALYSYEEYEAGAEMLYRTVLLRAESVWGQINGTIPATDEGQRADASNLVDGSNIDISVMGVMDRGGEAGWKSRRAKDRQ
ncbi:MAG: CotH kinase family protein, partial [Lachnospiraceae bacterium]|nr:CotH kinase family protein [Lachnospiraceae bacterium]